MTTLDQLTNKLIEIRNKNPKLKTAEVEIIYDEPDEDGSHEITKPIDLTSIYPYPNRVVIII